MDLGEFDSYTVKYRETLINDFGLSSANVEYLFIRDIQKRATTQLIVGLLSGVSYTIEIYAVKNGNFGPGSSVFGVTSKLCILCLRIRLY